MSIRPITPHHSLGSEAVTPDHTHAHAKAWSKKSDWGATTELKESYVLIVVGGGLSGLAAAYFYQQEHGKDKKVLILDNHDDFGGHAKRNEHTVAYRAVTELAS